MNIQLLIAAMALGVCVSFPVKREQREFVYQEGYPSVRRYPVYIDRLSTLGQALEKMAVNQSKDVKNELLPLEETLPSAKPPMKLGGVEPEVEIPEIEEPAQTESLLSLEPESTTTARPISTTRASLFDEEFVPLEGEFVPLEGEFVPLEGASSTLGGGFSFTPKPSSLQNESIPTGPVHSIFQADPVAPFLLFNDGAEVDNSVFPPGRPEESPVSSSSFGVFTDAPEDSTDITLTTDMVDNDYVDENEASPTTSPLLEEMESVMISIPDERTDAPFLDQTATEAAWNPVTQEIYTTEESGLF